MELDAKPDIEYLTRLARMELSETEKASLGENLDAIIGYMNVLSKIDTEGVEPMEHVLGLSNVTRADEPAPSYDREKLLACAPNSEDGYYDVPIAVEKE
jgi:aspartyl-tRNA(Asn)/glutamyl-tRNA(Gln) amidotransferase subunit C